MFGAGLLSRLLGGGTEKAVINRYGSEIGANLARAYGDDIASSVMARSAPKSMLESSSKLSQLLHGGVPEMKSINPALVNSDEIGMLYNANKNALARNDTFGSKVYNVGKNLEEAGGKLKNQELIGSISDPRMVKRANQAIKFADEVGLPSNQYGKTAEILTGKDGLFSTMNRNVLENSDVSVRFPTEIREKALKSVDDIATLEPATAKNLKGKINRIYDDLNNKAWERVGTSRSIDPNGEAFIADLHKQIQELGELANKGTGRDARVVKRIYDGYRNDLKNLIENAGNFSGYAEPENINALIEGIKGANLPPKLQARLVGQIRDDVAKNGGLSYKSLQKMQADPVAWGQIAQSIEEAPLRGGVGYNRGLMGSPIQQVVGDVIGKPLASGVGKAMQVAGRAGQMAGQGQFNGALNGLTNVGLVGAGGLGALSLLGAGGGGQDGVEAPQITPGAGSEVINPEVAGAMGAGMAMGDGSVSDRAGAGMSAGAGMFEGSDQGSGVTVGGYSRDQLENAYVAALMDNNSKAANAIATMIDMIDSKESAMAKSEKSTSENAGKIGAALNVVNSLESMFNGFGGSQGVIMGNVTNALNNVSGGGFNAEVAAYNDAVQGSLAPIIKAMGDGGNLSDSDMKRAASFIPAVTDDPKKAKIKFAKLKELLANAKQE